MLAKARRLGCKPEQYTLTVLLLEVHDLPASYDDALVRNLIGDTITSYEVRAS